MYPLAITSASDRATIDRHVLERMAGERAGSSRADRIEILGPSREDARAGARRYEQAAAGAAQFDAWREETRRARHAGASAMSMSFVAQFVAQQQPGNAAHVENWRGARAAYSSADALGTGRGAAPSVSILI